MRLVVQRVTSASVAVDDSVRAAIGPGLLVLGGLEETDTEKDLAWAADKVVELRIVEDDQGKMNRCVKEVHGGGILLVPNFTVAGDTRKGRRPSFDKAMRPERAAAEFEKWAGMVRERAGTGVRVETGVFRAHMAVSLVNDGPVTIVLESPGAARPHE